MKKEASIDLAKLEEAKATIEEAQKTIKKAQETIDSIGSQFCEIVLDEIEKNPVFECKYLRPTHSKYSLELYPSIITVSDTPVYLYFSVSPTNDEPNLSSDFILMGAKFDCSAFGVSNRFIEPRKDLTFTLHFSDTGENMLLQYEKSGEN